jgi:hypothetical protein
MSGSRGAGPSPDGRHDDLLPEDLAGLTLHAPDDPRELAADRDAWLTEEEGGPVAASTGTWADRRASRRRRLMVTAGVLVVSLLIVAISSAVGAWVVGPQASAPPAAPLASNVPEPGQIGGLLPEDAVLQDGLTPITARSVRPAVIVLVPDQCDECEQLLDTVSRQAGSFGVSTVAVGGTDQADQLATLSETVGPLRVSTLTDPTNTLRATYGLTGTTLLLVRDDGVVVDVVREPTPDTRLEGALVDLAPAGPNQT